MSSIPRQKLRRRAPGANSPGHRPRASVARPASLAVGLLAVLALVLAGCSDDKKASPRSTAKAKATSTTAKRTATTKAPATTAKPAAPTTAATTEAAPTTSEAAPPTTAVVVEQEVFETPQTAAPTTQPKVEATRIDNVGAGPFYVATVKQGTGTVDVFESPAGNPKLDEAGNPIRISNPNENGVETVFLVEYKDAVGSDQARYLNVNLPIRPNGSTGWIREEDVNVGYHNYKLVVELGAHRISLFENGNLKHEFPIAVGTGDTPTPGGVFYIKELLQPPDPSGPYGVYAYGLSGYSNVLSKFAGGTGVVGIHGTNDESSIGGDVSHGCIRLHNADITTLAQMLPLGVPVEIRA